MTPSVLAIIGATIVFSSFLSGVFGMAGGMILLGVLLNYFDVATGMILFSIIQFFANGWRALQWRHYVLWPIFAWYLARRVHLLRAHVDDRFRAGQGAGLSCARTDAVRGGGASRRHSPEHRMARGALLTGVVTTVVQILAGVGGMFLDIFFQKSMLDRKTTNATKAVRSPSVTWCARSTSARSRASAIFRSGALAPAIVLAIAGTSLAPFVIERMTDHGFRQWTRAIIFAISIGLSGPRGLAVLARPWRVNARLLTYFSKP